MKRRRVVLAVEPWRRGRSLVLLVGFFVCAGALSTGAVQAAQPTSACPGSGPAGTCTVTFSTPGSEGVFTVPAGVTTLTVDVDGAAGGASGPLAGNPGVALSGAVLSVTPGEVLYAEVGGVGGAASGATGGAAGINGGGQGGLAPKASDSGGGGGGGESDLRTVSASNANAAASLSSRLIVAAGGGGGGNTTGSEGANGGEGFSGSAGGGGGPVGGNGDGVVAGGNGTAASGGSGGEGGITGGDGGGGGGGGLIGGGGGGGGGGVGGGVDGIGGAGGVGESSAPAGVTPGTSTTGLVSIQYAVPAASVSAPAGGSLSFGTQPEQTVSAAQAVTIANAASAPAPLSVGNVTLAGTDPDDYLVTANGCASPVAAGSSCTIEVAFAPQAASGVRSASLVVATDDPEHSSLTVALSGTAGPFPAGPAGAQGATGATGAQGPSGSPGTSGKIELVTCTKTKVHKKTKTKCSTKTTASPVKFTVAVGRIARIAHVSLLRAGRVYARGAVRDGRLVLRSRASLSAGRYELCLTWRTRGHAHTEVTHISLT